MPNCQNLMESNGYGGISMGRGMTRAFQRAKEREKRTPDVEDMAETVKRERLNSQGPDIQGRGRISGA